MEDQTLTARIMVASAMSFDDPAEPVKTKIVRHFLDLTDTVHGLTDEIVGEVLRRLRHDLEESPIGSPRFLLGVELVSILLPGEGEKGKPVSTGVEQVLKQYAKVLKETLSDNDHISVGNYSRFSSLSTEDYKLALDITQVIAVSTSLDSTGTINTLIRAIVEKAPEDAIKAKMEQLESLDFYEQRSAYRKSFYDVFVMEYLKRFYGMQEVMKQLRYSRLSTVTMTWLNHHKLSELPEERIWEMLKRNCEITNPNPDKVDQRILLTNELINLHSGDGTVKDWYEENFPHLIVTE